MIPESIIEKILDAADTYSIINETVKLKKVGAGYMGLCPFHNEKTPSFSVDVRRGLWHCFSCGKSGNIIQFVQEINNFTFPEAVKSLAQRYGIALEDYKESPEKRCERLKCESLRIVNMKILGFYRKCFLECPSAMEYAYGRWGKEYCDEIEIGYAPVVGCSMRDISVSENISLELIKELGLITDKGYDFYQNRIIMPIRSRYQQVLGFTARTMQDGTSPKYLNSKESSIFKKSNLVYGIDLAWKAALHHDKMYLVEGAPDCMRLQSIGKMNTVAALGTAWNEEKFRLVKRTTSKICFIPDIDIPKDGKPFGTGIEAVMKAGQLALKSGMSVNVIEIPEQRGKKADPDSYFTNIDKFESLPETDFILWLAEKLFATCSDETERSTTINLISTLLNYIKDKTQVSLYLTKLYKYCKVKSIWKNALKSCNTDNASPDVKDTEDLQRKYGFWVKDNCYYSMTEKGETTKWSNFTMTPLFHIKDTIQAKRLFMLHNSDGCSELAELSASELVSIDQFKIRVESLGNFVWEAGSKQLTKIKSYLFSHTEVATEIKQLGWNRKGFYAFANGIVSDGTFLPVDEYGIVRLGEQGNWFLPAYSLLNKDNPSQFKFEKCFTHSTTSNVSMAEFTTQLSLVYKNNGKVAFCFYLASLFKDVIERTVSSTFPLLYLFGPKSTGKSHLSKALLSLFYTRDYANPNICTSSIPSLAEMVASVSNAFVFFEEYKNDKIEPLKVQWLKSLADGIGRTRMNIFVDRKMETTAVDSSIIFSGQDMPTADIALFSRLVFLPFYQTKFSIEEQEEFAKLMEMCNNGMTHITLNILRHRNHFISRFPQAYIETTREIKSKLGELDITERILQNWSIILASYIALADILDMGYSVSNMKKICVENIIYQNKECSVTDEIGKFWSAIQYFVHEGELVENGDFKIRNTTKFTSDQIQDVDWKEPRKILYFQKSRAFALYRQYAIKVGEDALPEESLRYYLEHSDAYMGNQRMKFLVFKKGVQQYDTHSSSSPKKTIVQRSMCFDYERLVKNYDINFETGVEDDK